MFQRQNGLAVLLFANSPEEELKHKPIQGGHQLFDYFTERTLTEIRKTGLPFMVYSEREQQGVTFAERFSNAIKDLFNSGYEAVITIGNDSPDLKASDLLEASRHLLKNNLVIGPALDGGIYLLGIHKQGFNEQAFLNLPWQTRELAGELKKSSDKGTIVVQRKLRDVDAIRDLKWFLQQVRVVTRAFRDLLIAIFFSPFQKFVFQEIRAVSYSSSIHHNKGSPLF